MGIFSKPTANFIYVKTKPELIDAIKQNYGKIFPIGELKNDLINTVRINKIAGIGCIFSLFASSFFPPALYFSVCGLYLGKFQNYKVCEDPVNGLYLRHIKL